MFLTRNKLGQQNNMLMCNMNFKYISAIILKQSLAQCVNSVQIKIEHISYTPTKYIISFLGLLNSLGPQLYTAHLNIPQTIFKWL